MRWSFPYGAPMNARTARLGFALPLFVAPLVAACSSKGTVDNSGSTTTTGPGSTTVGGSTTGGGMGGAGGTPTTSTTGTGGAGGMGTGVGGAGGMAMPVCGDGKPAGGQACYGMPKNINAEGQPSAIAVGDWNGGGADVIYNLGTTVYWASGDGKGGLGAGGIIAAGNVTTKVNDIAVGQLDSGKNLDVIVASNNTFAQILFGDGKGGYGAQLSTNGVTGAEGGVFDLHVADIAGSGASDDLLVLNDFCGAAIATSGTEGAAYIGAKASPCVGRFGVLLRASKSSTVLASVPLNGINQAASVRTTPLTVTGNTITLGKFIDTALEAAGARVATADFDGDGAGDAAVLVAGDKLNLLFGDGGNGWKPQGNVSYVSYPAGAGAGDLAVGDFDGDGDPDLAIADAGKNGVLVLLNDGKGKLSPTPIDVTMTPGRIAAGDLNGDKVDDIVVTTVQGIAWLVSNP